MEVKEFKLICEGGGFAITQHTDINVVKNLYLNQLFRDLDMSLKLCIGVELHQKEEKSELIEVFNEAFEKRKKAHESYMDEKKKRWYKDLDKCNEIFDTLSFLQQKGFKVEKVCCTSFNPQEANNGFYPYLRISGMVIKPLHKEKDFSVSSGRFQGFLFTYKEFVKKLADNFTFI